MGTIGIDATEIIASANLVSVNLNEQLWYLMGSVIFTCAANV